MKVPRDLSGSELAALLRNHGYRVVRQSGSHLRLTANVGGVERHVTIPAHHPLKVGTLSGILSEVATQLKMDREELAQQLFGQ